MTVFCGRPSSVDKILKDGDGKSGSPASEREKIKQKVQKISLKVFSRLFKNLNNS